MNTIAFLSPLPPAPTGVATYAGAVLSELKEIGFTRRHRVKAPWPLPEDAEALAASADLAVYHVGNNLAFHHEIYSLSVRHPGLLVLHDPALDDLAAGLLDTGDPFGPRTRAEAEAAGAHMDERADGPLGTPWCAFAARRARGIVVHSPFVARYLRSFGCLTPTYVVPHPAMEPPSRRSLRGARRIRAGLPGRMVVGVLGDMGAAKGIGAVLEAAKASAAPVHVAVVGRRIPGFDVEAEVAARGMESSVTVAGDVSHASFMAWLAASDVVVNLRHPHRGEVSGTLIRAMAAGVPVVVSGEGTYLDLPPDAVVTVAAGPPDPVELAVVLDGLWEDPASRGRLGERCRAHMDDLRGTRAAGRGYAGAIEATLTLLHDPARTALGRWAGALGDMGADPDTVRAGLGASYLDALDEVTGARGS